MTMFIALDDADLNLACVAGTQRHHRKTRDGRAYTAISFFDHQKRLLGHLEHADFLDLEVITAPVVAAAPGSVAAILHTMTSDDSLGGCPDEIYAEQLPVVAWRLLPERAVAVLPEEVPASAVTLLLLPDGRWLEPGSSSHATLEEAQTALLKRAQADWHRERTRDNASLTAVAAVHVG